MRKRYRITKKGKVLANKTLRRHMMTDRSPKKKRQLRRKMRIVPMYVKAIKLRLPYNQ
jgi:ribosomal protein L35